MGKSKRKSDSDLYAIQKKARKARSPTPSSASEDGEASEHSSDDGEGLFIIEKSKAKAKNVKKKTAREKRSRKSEPLRKVARFENEKDEEEEEGEGSEEEDGSGGMDTQDFLGIVEMQQKKKVQDAKLTSEFISNFTSKVEEDEEIMLGQIDTLGKESETRSSTFLTSFKSVFEASRPKALLLATSTSSISKTDLPSFLALQEKSNTLISNAHAILDHLTEADDLTNSMQVSDLINIEAINEASLLVERALKGGRRIGQQQTWALLEGVSLQTIKKREHLEKAGGKVVDVDESDHEANTDKANDDDERNLEMEFYGERSSDLEDGKGWGYHARKLEKLGRKMIKMGSGGLIVEH